VTVDLSTSYLGLDLAAPLMASSSPLTGDLDDLRALQDAGLAAVVLPSLFEEQIEQESIEVQRLLDFGAESFAEALGGYFPDLQDYNTGPGGYLRHLEEARRSVSIPVIASLNGTTRGGWVKYATRLENAGASALELNIYLVPTDPYADAAAVEQRYTDLVTAVVEQVSIPVAVKIGPFFSSLPHMAEQFVEAGASGLVLFNRFYQPDIDLEELEVVPNLKLSSPSELRLPLRWVAILSRRVRASLAITTGVHSAEDVLKALLVGADVAMMASALLRSGPGHAIGVLDGVRSWLEENEYESVSQLKGSMSLSSAPNPDAFIRSNYMKELASYTSGASSGP
jgi:dihydroorotate dehydrogenase (fumarate)